jgi:hypothetical protein
MSNKCPTCSQPGAERSNPQGEARCGEPVSRNANELDSASLRKVGAANPPEMMKPATVGRAALVCSRRAPRGGWRQRAGKEKSRNLRGPFRPAKLAVHRDVNPSRPGRESEGIVVAGKQGNSCGAKGSHCGSETIDRSIPACNRRLRDKTVRSLRWNQSLKRRMLAGNPDAGNPQVRFDEGEQRDWRQPPVALYPTARCIFPNKGSQILLREAFDCVRASPLLFTQRLDYRQAASFPNRSCFRHKHTKAVILPAQRAPPTSCRVKNSKLDGAIQKR